MENSYLFFFFFALLNPKFLNTQRKALNFKVGWSHIERKNMIILQVAHMISLYDSLILILNQKKNPSKFIEVVMRNYWLLFHPLSMCTIIIHKTSPLNLKN